MRASQIVQSWKLPTTVALFAAALIAFTSGAKGGSHLLSEQEKASVLGAYNDAPPPCYYVGQYDCRMLDGGDHFTGCGAQSVPNCNGDCTNACSRGAKSWACPESTTGAYSGCPQIDLGPNNLRLTCGFQYSGGGCVTMGGVCLCTGGNIQNPNVACQTIGVGVGSGFPPPACPPPP